ncbi:MAG TPA: hypothetical protein PKE30_15090 [Niabella sp.]|nr:hypothetical protein [Niabella sp.]
MKILIFMATFLAITTYLYAQYPPHRPPFPPHHLKRKLKETDLRDTANKNSRFSEPDRKPALLSEASVYKKKELRSWRRKKFWSVCNTVAGGVHMTIGIVILTSPNNTSQKTGMIITAASAALGTWGVLSIIKSQKNINRIKQERLTLGITSAGPSLQLHF